MFEKFGEFDSYREINELAQNLFNEGDLESIRTLAKENGIPEDFAEMFISGESMELCDALTAALGKLEVEERDLNPQEIMADWAEYVKCQCMENELMMYQVRKKGKTMRGCVGRLLEWSFKNSKPVEKEIVKAAGVTAGQVKLGIPGMGRAKKIIREYYLGK